MTGTASIAVFAIHAKRGKAGFKNLLGKAVAGIVCSDRWSVYALVDVLRRQLCWSHLKRDFQKFKELGGEGRSTGNAGLRTVKGIFEAWTEWKEKRIDRPELQARLAPARLALYRALERGRDGQLGTVTYLLEYAELHGGKILWEHLIENGEAVLDEERT